MNDASEKINADDINQPLRLGTNGMPTRKRPRSRSARGLIAIIVILACFVRLPGVPAHASISLGTASGEVGSTRVSMQTAADVAETPHYAAADSTPSPAPTATEPAVSLTARAAYAIDLTSGVELFANNADTPLAPASTTKIVTAIVVMRQASPDEKVTVQQDDTVDWNVYSHMGLEVGDVVTVRDLLAGMLLNSGGDAALTLSRYVGEKLQDPTTADPRQRFVNEMNKVADQLGMSKSHFLDPDGRDEAGHVTTARDLARATEELFQYQLLQHLVATRTETVAVAGPNARDITLYNTNEMLGEPGIHGVKTGTTDNAGECLVIASWHGNDRVITVVLGSTDRYSDMTTLLSYLDSTYRWVTLGRNGDLKDLNTELADKGYSLAVTKTFLLTAADAQDLHYRLTITPTNDQSGLSAQGEVVFLVGSRTIWQLPIYKGDPFARGG